MLQKINHIGVAVKDLEGASKLWTQVFGVKAEPAQTVGDMKVVMVHVGDVLIELLSPVAEQGLIAKYIEKRGDGVHHICYEVADINQAMKELSAKGMEFIDKAPREGAEGLIAFLHPKSTYGTLTEIVQVRGQ